MNQSDLNSSGTSATGTTWNGHLPPTYGYAPMAATNRFTAGSSWDWPHGMTAGHHPMAPRPVASQNDVPHPSPVHQPLNPYNPYPRYNYASRGNAWNTATGGTSVYTTTNGSAVSATANSDPSLADDVKSVRDELKSLKDSNAEFKAEVMKELDAIRSLIVDYLPKQLTKTLVESLTAGVGKAAAVNKSPSMSRSFSLISESDAFASDSDDEEEVVVAKNSDEVAVKEDGGATGEVEIEAEPHLQKYDYDKERIREMLGFNYDSTIDLDMWLRK